MLDLFVSDDFLMSKIFFLTCWSRIGPATCRKNRLLADLTSILAPGVGQSGVATARWMGELLAGRLSRVPDA